MSGIAEDHAIIRGGADDSLNLSTISIDSLPSGNSGFPEGEYGELKLNKTDGYQVFLKSSDGEYFATVMWNVKTRFDFSYRRITFPCSRHEAQQFEEPSAFKVWINDQLRKNFGTKDYPSIDAIICRRFGFNPPRLYVRESDDEGDVSDSSSRDASMFDDSQDHGSPEYASSNDNGLDNGTSASIDGWDESMATPPGN